MTERQLPDGDAIFLDHIGHFVRDIKAAEAALQSCGFLPTPFSVQTAPTGPDGAMEPTGTGNVCAMLPAGYLEFLDQDRRNAARCGAGGRHCALAGRASGRLCRCEAGGDV